jgi:hypothetical protein
MVNGKFLILDFELWQRVGKSIRSSPPFQGGVRGGSGLRSNPNLKFLSVTSCPRVFVAKSGCR